MDRHFLIDHSVSDKCVRTIEALNFALVRLPSFNRLPAPVSAHADMLFYRLSNNSLLVCEDYYNENRFLLDDIKGRYEPTNESVSPEYPNDVLLNALRVGDTVYAKTDSVSQLILADSERSVHVKQGYARCSVAMLGDSAAVTSDLSLGAALTLDGIDVLVIRPGYIDLPGYDTGFIGGCGGMLSPKTFATFGNISNHPDGKKIKNFAYCHGIDIMPLCDGILHDYGGFVII